MARIHLSPLGAGWVDSRDSHQQYQDKQEIGDTLSVELGNVELGQVVITKNLWEKVFYHDDDGKAVSDLYEGIHRHQVGDWGDLCDEDKALNDDSLKYGGRLLSSYKAQDIKFWIITEASRSITTLLLPEDY